MEIKDKIGSPITEGDTVVHLWSQSGKWFFEKGVVTGFYPDNSRSIELIKEIEGAKVVSRIKPYKCLVVKGDDKLTKEAMEFITAYLASKSKEVIEFKLPDEKTDVNPYFVEE